MVKDIWPVGIGCRKAPSWKISSSVLKLATGVVIKSILRTAHRVQTKNMERLITAIHDRPKSTALVTVSNHSSCIDDPVIWGVLPLRTFMSVVKMRWTPGASELVFTNPFYSWYFSRVGIVPISRGLGVYQRGMEYCLNLLNEGRWVHIFPEGKINMTLEQLRLKWGVGRMLAEAAVTPTVIPVWHVGMDDILPNKSPYFPRLFKKLTIVVGDPIDVSTILNPHNRVGQNAVLVRKQLTDLIQQKLYELKLQAETLHQEWATNSLAAYRKL